MGSRLILAASFLILTIDHGAPVGARPAGIVPPLGVGRAGRANVNDFNGLQSTFGRPAAGRAGRANVNDFNGLQSTSRRPAAGRAGRELISARNR